MNPPDVGVLSYGAYIPWLRMRRGTIAAAHEWFAPALRPLAQGERAIAGWDEDTVTMAVEAARNCLLGIDRETIGAVSLASTTLPFADRQNSGIVKEALNLSDTVAALDVTGSQRAATSMLLHALHEVGATGGRRLCVAADLRKAKPASEAELRQGDAAAAVLVGHGESIARLVGAHSVTIDFVDHFRASSTQVDYFWESRWVRDEGYIDIAGGALSECFRRCNTSPATIDHLAVAILARGVPEALAKATGVRTEAVVDPLTATVGDSGAPHPLLLLSAALDAAKPGEKIALVGFGQGCDVLIFEVTEAVLAMAGRPRVSAALAHRKPDANYLRFLFHRGLLDLERGMRAELDQKQPGTTLYRNRRAVLGLVGSRSTETGAVQFPPSELAAHSGKPTAGSYEPYPLADRDAVIVSYTADRLTYSPAPPQYYGTIDFTGGGRMIAEFTDVEPEFVWIGARARMVFRVKAIDELRDFKKYFWKAVPLGPGKPVQLGPI